MLLNVVTPERRLAHSPAGDMTLVAGLFVVALTYLDVPFWNALLFGPAITLQAAVGVVVLTRLLKGVPGSLLLLLGPGLILGGALSFAIFQLVGRGALGLVVVVAVGIGAVAILTSSTTWQPLSASRMWTLGQILGLAALALTWEFPELLPVAAAFFVLGFFTGDSPKAPRWLAWTVGALGFVAVALVPILRQDYWWLITDDYKYFEVLSFHITKSGPLADWGVGNFGKYHWLSYGWTGLLNVLGGNPEAFTTITRVMPILYAASLAASLLLAVTLLHNRIVRGAFVTSPAWTLIAVIRLDWSGLSTAAIYGVIAATSAVILICLDRHQYPLRRVAIYLIFGLILILTKLPSILAVGLFAVVNEFSTCKRTLLTQFRNPLLLLVAIGSALLAIPLVVIMSSVIGSFQVVTSNPGLGQLSELGPGFSFFAILISNLKFIMPTLIASILLWTTARDRTSHWSPDGLTALIPLLFLGVLLDVIVFGNANAHEYFSGPMYFVGSLVLLAMVSLDENSWESRRTLGVTAASTLVLLIAGVAWRKLGLSDPVWNFAGKHVFRFDDLEIDIMKYFSADVRVGAAMIALLLVPLSAVVARRSWNLQVVGLFISLTLLTLFAYGQTMRSELERVRTDGEVASALGPPDAQRVGVWMRNNTNDSELFATNYLYDFQTERPLTDFSLAAWSRREFLVLGPGFLPNFDSHVPDVELSINFGDGPTRGLARKLMSHGVQWFVVDKWNTSFVDWRRDWNVEYENDRFLVVML